VRRLTPSGEPIWEAEDEPTGCYVRCYYDPSSCLYVVLVARGEKESAAYFPAKVLPKETISEEDLLTAKLKAIELADKLYSSEQK
jgi:hypothetical protein